MDINKIAASFIKQFEGLSLKAYYCRSGFKTIGWGHVINSSDDIGKTITIEKAEELLKQDILKAKHCLYRNTKTVELNFNQITALISFIFNLGSGAFQSSTLRQKLLRYEYGLAALEFNKWVYARGRKLKGLQRRRAAEKNLFQMQVSQ